MALLTHDKATALREEAVARVEAFVAIDFRHSLRTILSALTASQAEVERLGRERDALHLAICGGEDAPGYAASLSHETVLGVLADNYASAKRDSKLAWDGETANTWKARATRAEGLLVEAGEVLRALDTVMSLDHARTCVGRVCDCDLEDTRDHRLRAARAFLDKLKGEG